MMGNPLQQLARRCSKWVACRGHWEVSGWCARRL